MFGKGFAKYLRRAPLSDEELLSALTWIRDEVNSIINGTDSLPIPDMPATIVNPAPQQVLLPEFADLEPFVPADDFPRIEGFYEDDDATELNNTANA